jgi:hypothetical protein
MEEDVQGSQETSERVSRAIFLSLTPPLDGADARGPSSSRYSALPLASTPCCSTSGWREVTSIPCFTPSYDGNT